MKYKTYRIGDIAAQYDEINKDLEFSSIESLQGINSLKYFQECKSNKNDIELNRYRICRNNTFAYNKATSRNGERISIAYRTQGDCLVSPSYITFSVTATDIVYPEYLMLWFMRREFDRYVRYNSWGSATEFFPWEIMANTTISVPPIEEQRKIVMQYSVIENRIKLLQREKERITDMLSIQFLLYTKNSTETVPLSALCDIVMERKKFSEIDNGIYISTENFLPNMAGIKSYGETNENESVISFQAGDLLIANIRPYFKKIWKSTVSGGCNADVLCLRPKTKVNPHVVRASLFQDKFFDFVMSGATGTKMPRGDKNHILTYPVPVLKTIDSLAFSSISAKADQLVKIYVKEIEVLSSLKTLLISRL